MRALPNREYRLTHHRRNQPLETAPIRGQFRFENGIVVIDDRIANRGNRAKRTQGLRRQHRTHNLKILMRALRPHSAIGVQQDIFGAMVFKAGSDKRPEFAHQLFITTFSDLLKFLHRALPPYLTLPYCMSPTWCYIYRLMRTRLRYYARAARLSRSKNK